MYIFVFVFDDGDDYSNSVCVSNTGLRCFDFSLYSLQG